MAISIGLQYGVPLETYVRKYINTRFDPAGMTNDADIRFAQSPVDYIFRRLALDYLSFDIRASYGIYTTEERARAIETGEYTPAPLESDKNFDNDTASDEDGAGTLEMKIDDAPEKLKKAGDSVEVKVGASAPHSTAELSNVGENDAPICMNCGVKMRPAGSCHICELCGSTSGCS